MRLVASAARKLALAVAEEQGFGTEASLDRVISQLVECPTASDTAVPTQNYSHFPSRVYARPCWPSAAPVASLFLPA